MTAIDSALEAMAQAGIPLFGCCRFDGDLVMSDVRSASRIPHSAKSIIVALFPYYVREKSGGNLSLYSCIPDYHVIAGSMLENCCLRLKEQFPQNEFVSFVDASPVREVTAALRAGLGVRGKNGQLITKDFGSLVFIGEIVTDLDLDAPSLPEAECENCGRCISECPTGALSEHSFDKTVCRSFFSQKKGSLTDWQTAQLKAGGLAWGCDICILACPHNSFPKVTPITEFSSDFEPLLTEQNLDRLMKNRAFAWRGEKVLRRNLSVLNNE